MIEVVYDMSVVYACPLCVFACPIISLSRSSERSGQGEGAIGPLKFGDEVRIAYDAYK